MPSNLNAAPAQHSPDEPSSKDAEFEEILYHITHDVRASLRAIKTLPEWILEELERSCPTVPEQVHEDFALLRIQAERADQILLDLRTYSRIGRLSDVPSMVDLPTAFSAALREADPDGTLQVETDFQAQEIHAPRNDVVTVFMALLSNAIKHNSGADKRIFAGAWADDAGMHLTFEDAGPGIAPEFHDRVFKLMTTLRSRDECEGSGVGLALVKKIVASQGGTVGIAEPQHLGGACVTACFPQASLAPTVTGPAALGTATSGP